MSTTYSFIKKLIVKGTPDFDDLKSKMDVFLVANRLTQEEYKELMGMINSKTAEENISEE